MTTIAYRAGIMAADSAASDDLQILTTRSQKIYRLKSGGLIGMSGDADARSVIALFENVRRPAQLPSKKDLIKEETDFDGLLVLPKGKVFHVWCDEPEPTEANSRWSAGIMEIGESYYAVGSGAVHAIPVLDAGRSARDAVLVACKRDFYSRPPIHTVPLNVET